MTNETLKKLLPDTLKEIAIFTDDRNYHKFRSSYMKVGTPALILRVKTEADIQLSVHFIALVNKTLATPLAVSIRSGGHGMSGASTNDGGVILDLSQMNQVEVINQEERLVRVQVGADWGKVATTLAPDDLVISSGNFGDVGVGGLAGSGGIGYFIRSQGLTLDHIQRATLVTATGEILHVSETENTELFWGIRGGASQLGVVTEYIFKAHKINSENKDASIINQNVIYNVTDIPQFVEAWGEWMRQAPRQMTSFLMLQKISHTTMQVRATNVWDGTTSDPVIPVLEGALGLAPVIDHQESVVPYPSIIPYPQSGHAGQQRIQIWDAIVDHVDRQLGEAIAASFSHDNAVAMELRFIGGAMNDIPTDATAWAARSQEGFVDLWMMPSDNTQLTNAFAPLKKLETGVYGAYSSNISPEVANLAWPGKTGERLKALIKEVDPNGLFNQGLRLK